MQRTFFSSRTLLALAVFAFAGGSVPADDTGDKPTLSGSWHMKDSEPALEFTPKGGLTIHPHGENNAIQIQCSYTLSKEGVVKATVKEIIAPDKVVEQVKNAVPIGLEFEFKWKVTGDQATLEGMEGKDVDHIKARLEGDYSKK